MDIVDFGAGLIMLLRWVGSVVLIIAGIVAATVLADRLRSRSRTETRD